MRHICVADSAMAGYAVSDNHICYCRLGGGIVGGSHGKEQAIGSMTGGTGVMNLVVTGAQRNAGSRAGSICMAARAFR